ncbi:MAG TPA: hypothetical protein VGM39_19680 [Kofleriaceae bacterium]|jgi:hypothetical protein
MRFIFVALFAAVVVFTVKVVVVHVWLTPTVTVQAKPNLLPVPLARGKQYRGNFGGSFYAGTNRSVIMGTCGMLACDTFTRNDCMALIVGDTPTDDELAVGSEIASASGACMSRSCDDMAQCIAGN